MKHAILALLFLPLSFSANAVLESKKSVEREIVVLLKEKSNINNDIIDNIVESERNRFALHFSTFTGEEVGSDTNLWFIGQGVADKAGVIKPDIILSDLAYEVVPCINTSAVIINAVCVNYKANVELTINSNAFMDEGEVVSFNGRLSKASRLLLKRDDKK